MREDPHGEAKSHHLPRLTSEFDLEIHFVGGAWTIRGL